MDRDRDNLRVIKNFRLNGSHKSEVERLKRLPACISLTLLTSHPRCFRLRALCWGFRHPARVNKLWGSGQAPLLSVGGLREFRPRINSKSRFRRLPVLGGSRPTWALSVAALFAISLAGGTFFTVVRLKVKVRLVTGFRKIGSTVTRCGFPMGWVGEGVPKRCGTSRKACRAPTLPMRHCSEVSFTILLAPLPRELPDVGIVPLRAILGPPPWLNTDCRWVWVTKRLRKSLFGYLRCCLCRRTGSAIFTETGKMKRRETSGTNHTDDGDTMNSERMPKSYGSYLEMDS